MSTETNTKDNDDITSNDVNDDKLKSKDDLNKSLVEAAISGNVDSVRTLLAQGAEIEYKHGEGQATAFHQAARGGHDNIIKLFISHGQDVNICNKYDSTPLMLAALGGHLSTVKLLHSLGAMLDLQNRLGNTALIIAGYNGHLELVAELLMVGADAGVQLQDGRTAEQMAKHKGHSDVATLLQAWTNHQNINKILIKCAEQGNERLVKLLISCGADILSTDQEEDGNTGYHLAAENGHVKVVRAFLEHGLDVNIRGRFGRTALMKAACSDKLGVVCELLERGADTTLQDQMGKTVLKWAETGAMKLVLNTKNIQPDDPSIEEVLLVATENGNAKMVSRLLEAKVNPDLYKNGAGETALLIAARIKRDDIVKKLLTHRLSIYDQTSIELKVGNIHKYALSEYCNMNNFKEREACKFHLVEDKDGVTLLEAIVVLKLVKEQEQVIDILTKIDKNIFKDPTDSQFRITEELKKSMPTSEGLRDIIESHNSRYFWSNGKKWFMIFLSFLTMLTTLFFFSTDVFTDLLFSIGWMDVNARTISNVDQINSCKTKFNEQFLNVTESCQNDLEFEGCKTALQKSLEILEENDCRNGTRFDNSEEPRLIFRISLAPILLSILMAVITWVVLEWGHWNRTSIFRLPLPLFTVPYQFYCDCNWFATFTRSDGDDSVEKRKKYEQDKEFWRKKLDFHATIVNLSKIVESAVESGFQFFFQTVFSLPSFILSVTANAGHSWTKLINWTTISIIMSFTSFSMAYYTIRNRDKKGALTVVPACLLMLKVILDSVSRILLFSSWLYIINMGHFSSIYTLIAYYTIFLVLMVINVLFSENRDVFTGKYWIGKIKCPYILSKLFSSGNILNSLSSILSYNNFDIDQMFGQKKNPNSRHQTTFLKQMIYCIIMTLLNMGLTIHTALNMNDEMKIVDDNGKHEELTIKAVTIMIMLGWAAFFSAWMMNIAFYLVHPSAVDYERSRFSNKMTINIFGKKKQIAPNNRKDFDETDCGQ